MIYPETKLSVADNSGVKKVKCINVYGKSRTSGAKPASLLVASVRKVRFSKNLSKGSLCRGLLIRGRKSIQRYTGVSIKFTDNSIVLVDQKGLPMSSRLIGPIYKELRNKTYPKVLSLAKTII